MIRKLCLCTALAAALLGAAQNIKLILSRDVTQKTNVLDWYPLQVGTKWVYKHEAKYGDINKPTVEQWTREVEIAQHVNIPEGLLVIRKARNLTGSKTAPTNQPHPYLIRGQYVYRAFLDPKTGKLDDGSRQRILSGQEGPELFFPLEVGLLFSSQMAEEQDAAFRTKNGKLPGNQNHWFVDGRGPHGTKVPGPVPPDAYALLFDSRTGPLERWFQKGVGIVGEWQTSSQNYLETSMLLSKFIPAGKK